MMLLRGLGWLLVLATAAIGIHDAVGFFDAEGGVRSLSTVEALWQQWHGDSLAAFRAFIEHNLADDTWTGVVQPVLHQPALAVFGIAALFCLAVGYAFRRRDDSAAVRRRRRRR
jgi:hypothetical protein